MTNSIKPYEEANKAYCYGKQVKIMSNNIEGKVVVIRGASSGLGEATAWLLSTEGASVVLSARRVNRIHSLAGELADSVTGPDITENMRKVYEVAIPADSLARAVAFAMSQPQRVDVNEILFRPMLQEF